MATANTSSAASHNASQAAGPQTAGPNLARFKKIETERYMFNPNKGCKGPLVGYLLGAVDMPPIARGKDKVTGQPVLQEWQALLFKITEPCDVIGRDKKVVTVPAGSEVLTPLTFRLDSALARAANHPTHCVEVVVSPTHKTEIGKGQTLWQYDLAYDPQTMRSRRDFGPSAMLAGGTAVRQPPAFEAAVAAPQLPPVGTTAAEDAPF